jgi:hypothetical protein
MTDRATAAQSGDTFGPPAKSRETTRAEVKEHARERVRRGAAHGEPPSTWSASDLLWAFGDSPEAKAELERLEEQASAVHAEKARRAAGGYTSGRVRARAELIVRRWDKAREERRLALAMKQARRELGLDEPPAKEA